MELLKFFSGLPGIYIINTYDIAGIGGLYPVRSSTGTVEAEVCRAVNKLYFAGGILELVWMGSEFYCRNKQCMFLMTVLNNDGYAYHKVLVESCGRIIAVASSNAVWAW